MTAHRLFALCILGFATCLLAAGDLHRAAADDQDDKKVEKIKEKPVPVQEPLQMLLDKNKTLVPALIAALRDGDPEVRQTTAYTLVSLGKGAVPALTTALGDKDPELRANAANILGQFGKLAQDALPALLQALKDPDAEVRRRVIYAISRIVEASSSAGLASREIVPTSAAMPRAVDPRPRDPGLLLPVRTPKPLPPLEQN